VIYLSVLSAQLFFRRFFSRAILAQTTIEIEIKLEIRVLAEVGRTYGI
jgi:hypothetical protein